MNHHLTEEEIAICAEALERNEYASLPKKLREHLFECDQCANEVLMVAELAGDINIQSQDNKPSRRKTKRIITWSISIAAAAGLIVLISNLNFSPGSGGEATEKFITQNKPEQTNNNTENQKETKIEEKNSHKKESLTVDNNTTDEQSSKGKETPAGPVPGEKAPRTSAMPPVTEDGADTLKILAELVPNEKLEKLAARYEGNMRDDNDVSVKSPMTITSSNSHITIKWKNPQKKRLIIEVLNNKGDRILQDETQGEQYTIENLSEGLYYWKLISSNFDLIFCGKIVVQN